jgi:hypothetical protein
MGLLDYFSAVFGEMLSYHAVGELFFGGAIEATGLFKSIFFFAGFPLNVWPNLLAWLKLIACPLYTSFRSSGY